MLEGEGAINRGETEMLEGDEASAINRGETEMLEGAVAINRGKRDR